MERILQKMYDQHDIVCNQKYNGYLPYSFHLKAVVAQVRKHIDQVGALEDSIVILGAGGHDLIEDARMTINDVYSIIYENSQYNSRLADRVSKIIYACTEEKGKNRSERHSDKFFADLAEDRLAVFVKLCDIKANVLFSLLTNSSMYNKYRLEYGNLYGKLHIFDEYVPVWAELEKLLHL